MRRITTLITIILLGTLLSGCQRIEVSERAFVLGMGVDRVESGYTVSVRLFGEETEVYTAFGRTPIEALSNIEATQDRRIYIGHCKFMIFGKDVKAFDEVLSPLLKGSRFPPGMMLFYGKDEAEGIIYNTDQRFLKLWGNAYQDVRSVYCDVVTAYRLGTGDFVIPQVDPKGQLEGAFTVKAFSTANEMTPEQVKGYRIQSGTAQYFTHVVTKNGKSHSVIVKDCKIKKGKLEFNYDGPEDLESDLRKSLESIITIK